ncbi:MAG: hypothetical protein MI749_17560 [Desulfovibrionales bacterium]|nr:hypothetical protein [Desulfovibrionales bacterium]
MRKIVLGVFLLLLSVPCTYAADTAEVSPVGMITINDLVGKTLAFSWQSGPFKDAAHLVTVVDPNTLMFSIESGKQMSTPKKIRFESMQPAEKVIILTWRSTEYGQTLVLTLDFENHMIFEVVVTKRTNYLSRGPFVLKK